MITKLAHCKSNGIPQFIAPLPISNNPLDIQIYLVRLQNKRYSIKQMNQKLNTTEIQMGVTINWEV
jgi:hypothetical protein